MIAKFDSYRKFETPMLYVCNPGCVLKDGLLTNTSGILADISDIEIIPTFNATSQLNFRCYKARRDDPDEYAHAMSIYRSLRNRRLIYAEGIGFFVITDFTDGYSNKVAYKDITAESCEVELRAKNLPYIGDGTYKFYTGEAGNPGMIETLVSYAPLWTLGYVDADVAARYRTFEDVDFTKNILGFMLEDLQDAYECLFVFDIINRRIDIYDQSNYVRETDIHLTKGDFIKNIDIKESSDDLYTALRVSGDEELSINAVNPLGTSVIYNFDYYLDWMTPALSAKVVTWRDKVKDCASEYYNIQLARYANLTALSNEQAEKERLETQLKMYTRCRENIVAQASPEDIAAYNAAIMDVGGVPIPDPPGYMWVMFGDDAYGANITSEPYGKNYIGVAYDKGTEVPSVSPSDYEWHTFRSGESIPRTVGDVTTYTWIVFADSIISGMSNDPDEKVYMGIATGKTEAQKSTEYGVYSWSLLNKDRIGIDQAVITILNQIEDVEADIAESDAKISALNSLIAAQNDRVSEIHNEVAFQEFFTDEEMDELSNYIIEGSYTDEYITVTEGMDYSQRFEQMKTLYDRSILQLEKIAFPTQEFTIGVENFIFVKEFERWSEQLETGCLINVEVSDNDVAALFLTSFQVNYEDKSLSMTFGNRYNRFDPKALFNKVLGSVTKTANTLSYIKDTIYPIKNGGFNKMKEALETSRTLSKNAVLSSANEQVTIDDTGYTGRRKLPDGTIDPKQIKINGRNIVFTDDAWETCKTAIGEIILSDDATAYGINAEVLFGNLIMGNELHIINSDGEDMFKVVEDNVMLSVGDKFQSKEEAIKSVKVLYCRANSSTDCTDSTITIDWSLSAPAWQSGEYIWQKTVTEYADSNSVESQPVCISGASGQAGVGVSGSSTKYATSSDGQEPPVDAQWVDDIASAGDEEYLWIKTTTLYTDGSESIGYSVSRIGESVGIENTSITYALSEDGGTPPEDGWSDIPQSYAADGKYLWTRTTTLYTDGQTTVAYSVSGLGAGISSIQSEYYLSSSDTELADGEWSTTPPSWESGKYIWTRSHIYKDNGSDTTTEPMLNKMLTDMGAAIGDCATNININKQGIQQNTEFYQELFGQLSKINAYIQTGVLSVDEDGRTTFGVKIGENLSSVDVYIVPGSDALSEDWLSEVEGGAALTPTDAILYTVKTSGAYYGKSYRWVGDKYEEASSEGTLSSIFTPSELGFYDTGEKTAYFSNKNLNVRTVRTNKILLSDNVIDDTSTNNWQIGIDHGFYLKWIGG